MIETRYSFKDEFGQETETRKTYTEDALEVTPAIEILIIDFHQHLRSCGFSEDLIKEFINLRFNHSEAT